LWGWSNLADKRREQNEGRFALTQLLSHIAISCRDA